MRLPLFCGLVFGAVAFPAVTAGQEVKKDSAAAAPLKVLVACSRNQLSHYQKYLESNYSAKTFWAGNEGKQGEEKVLQGLDALDTCDVMLLNLYRTHPTDEQLAKIQKYFKSGKPVVGLRKASHAFQNWLEVDRVVFGAKYGGHFFDNKKEQTVFIEEKAKHHPLVAGFKPFMCGGGLYNYTQLAPDVDVLMSGGPPGKSMPVTWLRINKETGGRVFYTRYDPKDLQNDEGCRAMVARALFWAAKREISKK
ncbi:MAG: ThuA domain-containing protein [Planctomycetes bacterium]|nr:ThuA domain-containing protein [Planctomycetota bacterium]